MTPPALPVLLWQEQDTKGRNYPSLAKRGDLPARSRFGEGRGEIFKTICLLKYSPLSNKRVTKEYLTSPHGFDRLRVVLGIRVQHRLSTNPTTNKDVVFQQSFGGKNDKVLSEDALARALRG
jgi:hypothetical protein